MQKDEEVGKVAQATPIVISKALELFLGLIIEQAHSVTAARGSKKVESYHLKHAAETTETLDFLKELVQNVPDPSAGGTIDLEAEIAENKKKRGKGKRAPADPNAPPKRRRKKKADADPNLMVFDDAPPPPTTGSSGRMSGVGLVSQDEDAEMQDDPDEYDEEEEPRPAVGGSSSSYRPRSPSDEDGWDDDKPFMPGRK